ncbi:hypothetical protein Syun_027145 [Stephania yunnanensis]|uniref:Apple domain-containing protein n=1 Tax=Stephania yunnanensis TaxID=152371 RepID=A0AAP0HMI9_9MAGN
MPILYGNRREGGREDDRGFDSVGESENFVQRVIREEGRGRVVETIREIEERRDAVREIERGLLELRQLSVLGFEFDVLLQVARASSFVRGGTQQLVTAKKHQRNSRKWTCYGIILLLIIILVIVLPIALRKYELIGVKEWKGGHVAPPPTSPPPPAQTLVPQPRSAAAPDAGRRCLSCRAVIPLPLVADCKLRHATVPTAPPLLTTAALLPLGRRSAPAHLAQPPTVLRSPAANAAESRPPVRSSPPVTIRGGRREREAAAGGAERRESASLRGGRWQAAAIAVAGERITGGKRASAASEGRGLGFMRGGGGGERGHLTQENMNLPDTSNARVDMSLCIKECEIQCRNNCSCTAYSSAYVDGSGCIAWFRDLNDVRDFPEWGQDLHGSYGKIKDARSLELVDLSMGTSFPELEVAKFIQVGILSIQENANYRPTTSTIILMLGNEITSPTPKQPGFVSTSNVNHQSSSTTETGSAP